MKINLFFYKKNNNLNLTEKKIKYNSSISYWYFLTKKKYSFLSYIFYSIKIKRQLI
jgi:hypothetical protein